MAFPKQFTLIFLLILSGCATLPSSGPTGGQIERSARDPKIGAQFKIVELTDFSTLPPVPVLAQPSTFFAELAPPPTDMVGPGDVLDISVYEAGVTLFGGSRTSLEGAGFDPTVKEQKLPPNRVDDEGYIQIPYAGRIKVAGNTLSEIEKKIRRSLRGMSQNPQVMVTIREAITNSVIVGGEVVRPGRLVLPTNRETLADSIALAGGYRGEAKDMTIRVQRRNESGEFRLSDVLRGPDRDMRVYPGDRITVVRAPRSFSVMGAPGKVELFSFGGPTISLAEAIAQAGGTNPNVGDPQAIYIFRFVPDETGKEQPVVYHLNMMKAGGFFVSQRFAMQDKDVLYFGNARANQPSKLIQIISQLFAPIVTVRDIARSAN